jgi:hypothetical protein
MTGEYTLKMSLLVPLVVLLATCASPEPEVVVIKITSTPLIVTATSLPTNIPLPTNTPEPTPTPKPRWNPLAIGEIEQALRDAGYRRYPFTTKGGGEGYRWAKENAFETVTTWEDHNFKLQVFHNTSQSIRLEQMEKKFIVLDRVMPSGFMAQLRQENESYNKSVRSKVSGEPDRSFAYGGEWQTVRAQYYTEETVIGGYNIWFSVWWWQSTCQPGYFCWYTDFPGLEFVGDSSFTFYSIYFEPIDPDLIIEQSS